MNSAQTVEVNKKYIWVVIFVWPFIKTTFYSCTFSIVTGVGNLQDHRNSIFVLEI